MNNVATMKNVIVNCTVNNAGPMKNVINNAYSTTRRHFNKITTVNNSNFTKKVNTVKGTRINTARPKAVLSVVKGNKGNVVKASACWIQVRNKSYLIDYEEIDGGFVAFGGNSKGDFKLNDESHILVKVPKKDNMYIVDLKNVVPQGGYSTNSKAFRVFNSRTRIVEENLHVQFSENTPNIAGSGPNWLFHIDALTKSMNYKPVVAWNQSNGSTGTKACDNAGKARMETIPGKDYVLLPLSIQDPPFSSSSKNSPNTGFKPSCEEEKKDVEDPGNEYSEVPSTEEPRVNQEKDASVNSTNTINNVSPTVIIAGLKDNVVDENIVYGCEDDPNMPELEEIIYSYDDENVSAEADINNLDTHIPISPIPTTKIHKDHPVKQIIGDIYSAPQEHRRRDQRV
ncbi:hypothetical protein Tco_0637894 [Tanacetum coccineum]